MTPYIDLHCDTLFKITDAPDRFFASASRASTHLFLSGLSESRCLLQCFAVFTDLCEFPDGQPFASFRKQYRCFRRILSGSRGNLRQIKTASDLDKCIRQNKIGALLTMEESCLSAEPAILLPSLFSLGVRMATLTWNYSTLLGCSSENAVLENTSPYVTFSQRIHEKDSGLTPQGLRFVEEAERLGIILDVSHLSDQGFFDVAAHGKRPFLASHSNCRSVCAAPRNLSDDMLRILANRGGLAGLCFHEPFLRKTPRSPEDIADALTCHVKHVLQVAGADILALGTDFDGTPGNRVIPNVTRLPYLEDILKNAGLTGLQIEKLFYKNALRFFKENLP